MNKTIQNIFLYILFSYIIFHAFIEGFRMPNLWSINYFLPSFFDDFYRRALPGTVLSFLGKYKYNYYVIASIQFTILFSLLGWIFWIFKKNILTMLIISMYMVSPFGGYLFHEVGYIDQLLYLILFISIAMYKRYKIQSIVLFSSSMFIHEIALFVTVPVFFTFIYINTENIKKTFLQILPSLIFFIIIYIFFQTVPIEKILLFEEQIMQYANYQYRVDFYSVFSNDFTGARNKIYYGLGNVDSLFLLTLVSIATAILTYEIQRNRLLSLLIFSTGIAPLFLGAFGWDLSRWFFLSFSSLVISYLLFIDYYKITFNTLVSNKWGSILILCYILLIGNMTLHYFNDYSPREMNKNSLRQIKSEILTIPRR